MVWVFVHGLRAASAGLARAVGAAIGAFAFRALGRLRQVGLRNLELAFPEKSMAERESDSAVGVPEPGFSAGGVLPDAGVYGGEGEPVYSL